MGFIDEVKKTVQNLPQKLKGSDNYLTSSIVLVGIGVLIILTVLLFQYFTTTKILQNALKYLTQQEKISVMSPTPTPSPTPIPLPKGPREFGVSNRNNPQLRSFKFNEYDPNVGQEQTVTVKVIDETSEVSLVKVQIISDHKASSYPLKLSSGTNKDGEWSATWKIEDTHNYIYKMIIEAQNKKGEKVKVEPKFR